MLFVNDHSRGERSGNGVGTKLLVAQKVVMQREEVAQEMTVLSTISASMELNNRMCSESA